MKPYKGYRATVAFDEDAMIFFGSVLGLRDQLIFEATDANGLVRAFHESVDDYLEWCAKDKIGPDRPFSGMLSLRVSHDLHRRMSDAAALSVRSLNQWMVEVLSDAADKVLVDQSTQIT